MLTERLQ